MASSKTTKKPKQSVKRSKKTAPSRLHSSHPDNIMILAAVVIIAGLVGWFAYGKSATPVDAGIELGTIKILPSPGTMKPDETLNLLAEAYTPQGTKIQNDLVYFSDWKVIPVSGGKGTIAQDPTNKIGAAATLKATSQSGLLNVMVQGNYQGKKVTGTGQFGINKNARQESVAQPVEIARIATAPLVGSVRPGGKREFFAEAFDARGKKIEGVKFTWKIQRVGLAHGSTTVSRSKDANGSYATFWAGLNKGYAVIHITGELNGKSIQHSLPVVIQ